MILVKRSDAKIYFLRPTMTQHHSYVSVDSIYDTCMVMNPDASFQFCADDPVKYYYFTYQHLLLTTYPNHRGMTQGGRATEEIKYHQRR